MAGVVSIQKVCLMELVLEVELTISLMAVEIHSVAIGYWGIRWRPGTVSDPVALLVVNRGSGPQGGRVASGVGRGPKWRGGSWLVAI
jgi:hypothetical protein